MKFSLLKIILLTVTFSLIIAVIRLQMNQKKTKAIPFDFVLEKLDPLSPWTRPMFGCHAIYVGEKIVGVLRKKGNNKRDNGVWIATSANYHDSLKRDFPSMRSIEIFGRTSSTWQILPEDADDFEESVMTFCEFILKGDERIGKLPTKKTKRSV
jgi:hypothetical protein